MSECRRTCWIAAGLMGLLVLALTSGAGDLGLFAGLVLGVLTATLVGSVLVFLVCEGKPAEALTADDWAADVGAPVAAAAAPVQFGAIPARQPLSQPQAGTTLTASAASQALHTLPARAPTTPADGSVPMTGAPPGASTNPTEAVTFTAAGSASPAAAVAAPPAAAAAQPAPEDQATPAPSLPTDVPSESAEGETPLEDTRAVLYDPSQSEDHSMPGEAVPASEPMPAAQPDPDQPSITITDREFEAAGPGSTNAGRLSAQRRKDRDMLPQGADDLGRIDGIGRKLTAQLHEHGITRYDQIAAWTDADVDAWTARLGRKGDRIRRDDWVGQARVLAAGGETAHSRQVDTGDGP